MIPPWPGSSSESFFSIFNAYCKTTIVFNAMFTNFENMISPSQSKVCFFFDAVKVTLTNRRELKHFIEHLFRKEGKKLLSLNYVFCSDKKLLQVNQDYLKHDIIPISSHLIFLKPPHLLLVRSILVLTG